MPSARHQALVRLLTERPEVLVALLERLLGMDFPDDVEIDQGPETVRTFGSEDYRVDGMIIARSPTQPSRSRAIAVEVQLSPARDKRERWVLYVVGGRARLRMETILVVFADSRKVADWARAPIELGNGSRIVPLVIGPDEIPECIAPEEARELPALAVLCIVAHGRGPDAERLGRLAIGTVRTMFEEDEDHAMLYMDVITAYLDDAVLTMIDKENGPMQLHEPISNYGKRFHALGRDEGRKEGRVEGYTDMLFTILETRGIAVPERIRDAVARCRDPETLARWSRRALVARELDDVFDE